MDAAPSSLVLFGAGKMGQALLGGWLGQGLAPERIIIVEPFPDAALATLTREKNIALNPARIEAPQALVLAIKPQMLEAATPALSEMAGENTLLISILAGKTIGDLGRRLPRARAIVRAMPNTPAAIGRGVTGAFANAGVSAAQRDIAHALLSGVGAVEWVAGENLIDAVTAVSGSGPAYVFHLVEALAQAGVACGLPADLSLRLARGTIEGAGELLHRSPELSAETLRKNVTSPGGTTQAALEVLMASDGLAALMARAVAAAAKRAGELSG